MLKIAINIFKKQTTLLMVGNWPGNVQKLFPPFCSGVAPGSTQETICDTGNT